MENANLHFFILFGVLRSLASSGAGVFGGWGGVGPLFAFALLGTLRRS